MYRLEYLLLFRTEISEISFPWGVCSNLKYLNISYCHSLVDVGALPTTLLSLHLIGCSELKKIRGLCDLSNLEDLDISECPEVETLPNFEMLTSLEKFRAIRCVKLKRIRGLSQMTNLRVIDVSYCWALNKLEGVEHLRLLEELHIVGYNDLQWGEGVLEQLRQRLKGCLVTADQGYVSISSGYALYRMIHGVLEFFSGTRARRPRFFSQTATISGVPWGRPHRHGTRRLQTYLSTSPSGPPPSFPSPSTEPVSRDQRHASSGDELPIPSDM